MSRRVRLLVPNIARPDSLVPITGRLIVALEFGRILPRDASNLQSEHLVNTLKAFVVLSETAARAVARFDSRAVSVAGLAATDRFDLSAESFYEKMATAGVLPETAAPAPGQFQEVFSRLADDGARVAHAGADRD